MANRYADPNPRYLPPGAPMPSTRPPGMVWVPMPDGGHQLMPVEQARTAIAPRVAQGRAAGGITLETINSPDIAPPLRAQLQDPRVLAAMRSGATTEIKVPGDTPGHDTTFTLQNGRVTDYTTGGWKKPVAFALGTAAGGYFGGQALGGTGAAGAGGGAGGSAASTAAPVTGLGGAGGAGGAAGATGAALGPSTPASMAATQAVVQGSTVPASLAAPAAAGGSWLGGLGRFLGSPGGAAALGVGGQLIGAGLQASGTTAAANAQLQATREALAYEKERDAYLRQLEASRYGELTGRLQPYIAGGQGAADQMMRLMGLQPEVYRPPAAPPPPTSMAGSWQHPPVWPGAKG
jgi:hypothetical protein